MRTLLHCWWKCKLIETLWRTVWRFHINLGIKPTYDPTIPILGMYTEKTTIAKETCTPMFISTFSQSISLVTQSYLTICHHMDCSTPGFPVYHQLLELAQTHVHWVRDAIQSSHPLPCSSPSDSNLSQHQGLFQWVSSLHKVSKVSELQIQYQCFQWKFWTGFLHDWLDWSPCSQRNTQKSSLITQLKTTNSSVLRFLYGPTFTSVHDYWKNLSFH